MALKKVAGLFEGVMVVEGSGSFPFDMLRYDNAIPLREEDAGRMERDGEQRRIALRWFAYNKKCGTDGRTVVFLRMEDRGGRRQHEIFNVLPRTVGTSKVPT